MDAHHFLFPCSNSYQYPTAAFTRPSDKDADTYMYKSYIPFVILVDTVLLLLLLLLLSDRVITSTPGSVVVPGDFLCFWLAEGGVEGSEVDTSGARSGLTKLPLSWDELRCWQARATCWWEVNSCVATLSISLSFADGATAHFGREFSTSLASFFPILRWSMCVLYTNM